MAASALPYQRDLRFMPKVKFVREKKEVEVEPGANLRKVAIREGIELYPGIHQYLNCMGFGQCASCRVHVTKGAANLSPQQTFARLPFLLRPITLSAPLGN